jgi:hypothetical protein
MIKQDMGIKNGLMVGVLLTLTLFLFPKITNAITEETNQTQAYVTIPTDDPYDEATGEICDCLEYLTGTGYKTCSQWRCYVQQDKKLTINPSDILLDQLNYDIQLIVITVALFLFISLLTIVVIILKK